MSFRDRYELKLVKKMCGKICSLESRIKLLEELKPADVVVLTYACDLHLLRWKGR